MTVELHIQINNVYIPVLSIDSIPVDDCNRFALNPLWWLRFLGYIISGNQGNISATVDGPPVDYDSVIEEGLTITSDQKVLVIYSVDSGFAVII